MDNQPFTHLELEISIDDSSDEEVDKRTRQLLNELRDLNEVESVELLPGITAPAGTKGADPVTIGALAVTILPNLLPKLVDFIQNWVSRGQGRKVVFTGKVAGHTVHFEGSVDDFQKVVAALSK